MYTYIYIHPIQHEVPENAGFDRSLTLLDFGQPLGFGNARRLKRLHNQRPNLTRLPGILKEQTSLMQQISTPQENSADEEIWVRGRLAIKT